MKIIFYRYRSICEPDFIGAFKKLGITVVEDTDGMDSSLSVTERMSRLGNFIADNTPMFVFSINFFPFIAMVCERIGVKYVAESVDCPVLTIFHKAMQSKFNKVFLFDYRQYEDAGKINPDGIFYLPLGAPVERTTEKLGDTDGYKYDVSFVGSLYKEKDPYLDLNLQEAYKKRFGGLFRQQMDSTSYGLEIVESTIDQEDVETIMGADEGFHPSVEDAFNIDNYVAVNEYLSPHIAYLERVEILNSIAANSACRVDFFTQSDTSDLNDNVVTHGGADSLNEMPFIFRQSRINLNITMRSIQTGIPQRIWDVLACGGFLLTNDQPELHEYFEVGKHLEVYRNRQELMDKIDYYLKHEDVRKEIAINGYREVCEKHTVLHRVMSMIKSMQ